MAEDCWTWGNSLSKRHFMSTVILACYHCWQLQLVQLNVWPAKYPLKMWRCSVTPMQEFLKLADSDSVGFPPTFVSCSDAVVNDLPPDSHPWLTTGVMMGRQADATNQWDVGRGGSSEPAPLPGNPRQRQNQKVDFQFLFYLKKKIKKSISPIKIEKQPLNLSHLEKKMQFQKTAVLF